MGKKKYQFVTLPPARRALRKLPIPIRKHIIDAVQVLAENPHHGEKLEGQFRFLRSLHTICFVIIKGNSRKRTLFTTIQYR